MKRKKKNQWVKHCPECGRFSHNGKPCQDGRCKPISVRVYDDKQIAKISKGFVEKAKNLHVDAKQIDGRHYKEMGIQPWELIERGKLDYWEGNIGKYLLRWKTKDGIIDLKKIIHYAEKVIERAERGCYGKQFEVKP